MDLVKVTYIYTRTCVGYFHFQSKKAVTRYIRQSYVVSIDLYFATSKPKFLPTQIGKRWKAISANQEKIIFVNNVTKLVDFVKNKTTKYDERCFYLIERLQKMFNFVKESLFTI